MENTNGERSRRGKFPHFVHSPFTLDHNGVRVACDENGKITMTKNHDDESYDEIETSASLINRVYEMLQTTKKKIWKDEPYREPQ